MFNLLNMLHIFNVRVNDAMLVLEKWWQTTTSYVAVFIDSGCQYCTTMAPVPLGIVRASSKKGYPERGSRNDHIFLITQDFSIEVDAGHVFDVLSLDHAKFFFD